MGNVIEAVQAAVFEHDKVEVRAFAVRAYKGKAGPLASS